MEDTAETLAWLGKDSERAGCDCGGPQRTDGLPPSPSAQLAFAAATSGLPSFRPLHGAGRQRKERGPQGWDPWKPSRSTTGLCERQN